MDPKNVPGWGVVGHAGTRVATAQGKQGIWLSVFPDRENMGNLGTTRGKLGKHRQFP